MKTEQIQNSVYSYTKAKLLEKEHGKISATIHTISGIKEYQSITPTNLYSIIDKLDERGKFSYAVLRSRVDGEVLMQVLYTDNTINGNYNSDDDEIPMVCDRKTDGLDYTIDDFN